MIDGIKFHRDGGWALVLPDASEPFFTVYAEGNTGEQANDLLCHYATRIEALRG